ncbi:glycosyltransferase [Nocardiopsis tropica]|uniref:Glycosyltransferase n=1 Tax=Nocardiopsis tropica TaxID=109330 RepID=A0ABU7KKR0_9ACTN|nr:glycosyltransferase [Nocardiopsis umidischolae]MEE2049877.1 glycosyltransferase [Nocardiopsis umidischolae]
MALRILLVSGIRPWDPFGGAMRTKVIAGALAGLGTVDLLVLPLDGKHEEPPADSVFDRVLTVPQEFSPLDQDRSPARRVTEFLRGTLAAQIGKTRGAVLEKAPDWLAGTRYDLVWYMREHVWLMTRGLVSAPTVIDVDDLRDVLLARWLSIGKADRGMELTPVRRLDMHRVIARWRRIHRRAAQGADVLIYSGQGDLRRSGFPNSLVVPNTYTPPAGNGVDGGAQAAEERGPGRPTILFQGVLSYAPNADAAAWLVKGIAPLVRKEFPDLRVLLAGQSSPRIDALGRSPGVEVTGIVPSMTPYLRQADLVVAPLRVAGGTRIKILEAFAHRVPVVSTTVGAEGLEVRAGEHCGIADTTEAIADECVRLLSDRAAARATADRAHELYDSSYRPERAAEQVARAVDTALSGRR